VHYTITSEHYEWERSGRHSKRLDALRLATVNMLAKDEPSPHRYFDHSLGGEWNDHRDWARIRRLPKSVIPGRPAGAGP
jgi:mRNA-degrading endonuclease YafQ of YafQ-DinJ toxin-antitoxin module